VASGDDSYYEFEILQAGSVPGDVDDSKPQGGTGAGVSCWLPSSAWVMGITSGSPTGGPTD
ncbi:hypothetical protein ACWDAZ_39255, partial [Streptomyces sp. NPDC001215]